MGVFGCHCQKCPRCGAVECRAGPVETLCERCTRPLLLDLLAKAAYSTDRPKITVALCKVRNATVPPCSFVACSKSLKRITDTSVLGKVGARENRMHR